MSEGKVSIWLWMFTMGICVAIVVVTIVATVYSAIATSADQRACRRSGRMVVLDDHNEWTCREVKP